MLRPNCSSLIFLTAAGLSFPSFASAQETAAEIVDRIDQMWRGESSRASMEMTVVTEHWTRTIEMAATSMGTTHSLIRILAPRRDAGSATLKVDNDIWNYLPRVDRTIKIPSSMMGSSWMGSHMTNDDLVKDSRLIEDFEIEITFEGVRDGSEVWEFTLTPREEAAVIWGSIVEEVRKDDYMPTWVRYYDERGDLVRTMTFGEYSEMGGRLIPALMTMVPVDKPEESTSFRYTELEFEIGVDESFFSLRRLRSER
jgi:hypothetical protein